MSEHESKSLEELLSALPDDARARVREYAEGVLAGQQKPEAGEPGPGATVSLREVTGETVRDICRLSDTLKPPKKFMVAPNAFSIAEAYFQPKAWFRAVYADDAPVGFVMLYDDPEKQEYFLWRFMIAGQHHGKGFGRRALEQLIDYVRTRPGATALETSCGQGPGSPEGFYRRVGFERSGKMLGDEVGLILRL
jgi:diamine N-acetyltransferase